MYTCVTTLRHRQTDRQSPEALHRAWNHFALVDYIRMLEAAPEMRLPTNWILLSTNFRDHRVSKAPVAWIAWISAAHPKCRILLLFNCASRQHNVWLYILSRFFAAVHTLVGLSYKLFFHKANCIMYEKDRYFSLHFVSMKLFELQLVAKWMYSRVPLGNFVALSFKENIAKRPEVTGTKVYSGDGSLKHASSSDELTIALHRQIIHRYSYNTSLQWMLWEIPSAGNPNVKQQNQHLSATVDYTTSNWRNVDRLRCEAVSFCWNRCIFVAGQ